jgi:hypothetical protein
VASPRAWHRHQLLCCLRYSWRCSSHVPCILRGKSPPSHPAHTVRGGSSCAAGSARREWLLRPVLTICAAVERVMHHTCQAWTRSSINSMLPPSSQQPRAAAQQPEAASSSTATSALTPRGLCNRELEPHIPRAHTPLTQPQAPPTQMLGLQQTHQRTQPQLPTSPRPAWASSVGLLARRPRRAGVGGLGACGAGQQGESEL